MLEYLPRNGLFFAGSVARGLFEAGLSAEFLAELGQHRQFTRILNEIAVSMIKDDSAALVGCAVASQMLTG